MKPLDPITAKILFGLFQPGCRSAKIAPRGARYPGLSVRISKKMLARLISAIDRITPVDPPPVIPPRKPITPPEPPVPPLEADDLDLI